jgi:hypothetical protein
MQRKRMGKNVKERGRNGKTGKESKRKGMVSYFLTCRPHSHNTSFYL